MHFWLDTNTQNKEKIRTIIIIDCPKNPSTCAQLMLHYEYPPILNLSVKNHNFEKYYKHIDIQIHH